jgi:hypothetical protein
MAWKTTPESWTKAFWWNLRREMEWEEYEGKSNPLVPHEIVKHIHTVLKTFTASEQSPAMLARGSPMNHHQMQNEGGGEGKRPERLWCHHPGGPTNPHSRGLRPISSSL